MRARKIALANWPVHNAFKTNTHTMQASILSWIHFLCLSFYYWFIISYEYLIYFFIFLSLYSILSHALSHRHTAAIFNSNIDRLFRRERGFSIQARKRKYTKAERIATINPDQSMIKFRWFRQKIDDQIFLKSKAFEHICDARGLSLTAFPLICFVVCRVDRYIYKKKITKTTRQLLIWRILI